MCQVIKDRVMENAVRSPFTWNTQPGSLVILPEFSQSLDRYPFYWRHLRVGADTNSSSLFTAVVYVTSRSSLYSASPLHRLMRALSKSSTLHKVQCSRSMTFFCHCRLLNIFKARITSGISDVCPECGVAPHSVEHLFNCQSHPTQLTV